MRNNESVNPQATLAAEETDLIDTRIAIIGGGCSGTLLAVHLLRNGFSGQLTIVEPRRELGRGVAYSTPFDQHLLNVPAGKMSALPHDANHFLVWLQGRGFPESSPGSFAPRKLYGAYLESVLQTEIGRTTQRATVHHLCDEVVDVGAEDDSAWMQLRDGTRLRAGRIVLALGNPASSPTANITNSVAGQDVDGSPWFADSLRLRFAGERILLLGTGLTAIDALLALLAQSELSRVYMVSRRGLLPATHTVCRPAPDLPPLDGTLGLSWLVREWRKRLETMQQAGLCWRTALDAVRPASNRIWSELPLRDRQRFLRHLKPYWEPHRHRMAGEVAHRTSQYQIDGRLHLLTGRIAGLKSTNQGAISVRVASLRAVNDSAEHQQETQLEVDRVIRCTGVHENYLESARPLIRSLIANGIASANELGLGFRTDDHGALINRAGQTSNVMFTLGPPRRGQLFETTAVPEIRAQAVALALHLL